MMPFEQGRLCIALAPGLPGAAPVFRWHGPRSLSVALPLLFAALVLFTPRPVDAQPDSPSEAMTLAGALASSEADRLFREGRQRIEAGQPAQACELLAKSQQLESAVGTLLNLGLCHRQCNRLASARRSYMDAERLASEQGDPQRAELASMEAAELERLIGRVVVEAGPAPEHGLALFLDGQPLARAEWGTPIPADAGAHVVRAEAPGYRPWQVEVGCSNGSRLTLRVPALEPEPSAASPAGRKPRGEPPEVSGPNLRVGAERVPPQEDTASTTFRDVGVVGLGCTGLVALAVGGYFAFDAMDKNSDSEGECRTSGVCTAHGVALRDGARDSAAVATTLGTVGVGALVGAGVLWLSAPTGHEAQQGQRASHTVDVALTPAQVAVRIGGEF